MFETYHFPLLIVVLESRDVYLPLPNSEKKTYYHRQGRVEDTTKGRYAIMKNTCIHSELSCFGGTENGGARTRVT